MHKRLLTLFCAAALIGTAACGTDEDESVTTEVSTMPGEDTINMPTVVPTTDSIVTRMDVDTIRGEGAAAGTRMDSMRMDSMRMDSMRMDTMRR